MGLANYRIVPQMDMFLEGGLHIDNFAGGGGVSMGFEMATGKHMDHAINHDKKAIDLHKVNHPLTEHHNESVWDVCPKKLTAGRPVENAWFSPDCTHFSIAKGGTPVDKNVRGLAWVILRYAGQVAPKRMYLENVKEFMTWGPLVAMRCPKTRRVLKQDGTVAAKGERVPLENQKLIPDPKRKGEIFKKWRKQIQAKGYEMDWNVLKASDYGAPTSRKRLFGVMRNDGRPIVWPEPTHGTGKGLKKPLSAAKHVIDWSLPCKSIFERDKPYAEKSLKRIAAGVRKFVIENPTPFIAPVGSLRATFLDNMYGKSSGVSVAAPMPTVTTRQKIALVEAMLEQYCPDIEHPNAPEELWTAHLLREFGQSVGQSVTEPVPTIVCSGMGKTRLVCSHLIKYRGTCRHGVSVEEPTPTVTSGGLHLGEVRTFLETYCPESEDDLLRRGLVKVQGVWYQIVDIQLRMLTSRELYRAQGFPDTYRIDYDADGRAISKSSQVARCGNAVPPPLAAALFRANYVLDVENQRIEKRNAA